MSQFKHKDIFASYDSVLFLDIVILGDRYANGLKCFVITMIGTIILSFGLIYFEKKSKVIEKLF